MKTSLLFFASLLVPLTALQAADKSKPNLVVIQIHEVARLYHLAADPQEMEDLASDPKQATRKKQLFDRLFVLQREYEDPLDLMKAFPGW